MSRHSLLPMLSLYLIAAIVPCGLAGIGLVWLVSGAEGLTTQPDPSKTVLDARIETAREIRRVLATPIPPPEPLGPIQFKAASTLGGAKKVVAAKRVRLPQEARDAFASGLSPSYEDRSAPARAFDRHTNNY